MSVIKYKNSKGEYVTLSGYAVSTTETVQTTGNSVAKVMSQNAVTEELNKKANADNVYTKDEVDTAISNVNVDLSDYYNKTQVDTAINDSNKSLISTIAEGTTNGTISVTKNDVTSNVYVHGLGSAAYTNSSNYAAFSHTHSINDITNLQSTLDNKASTLVATSSTNGLMSSSDKEYIDFLTGCNTLTSVSNVPITKRLCIVTISSNSSLSLASIPSAGRDIHLIIKNNSSSNNTITIPNNTTYINIDGDNITIGANSYGEINMISDGSKIYIRAL